jgi:hypothetical protein
LRSIVRETTDPRSAESQSREADGGVAFGARVVDEHPVGGAHRYAGTRRQRDHRLAEREEIVRHIGLTSYFTDNFV